MSYILEEKQPVVNDFQQELVIQFLLDNGVITEEQIQKAFELQKKSILEGKKTLNLNSYYIDQKNYSVKIKNVVTNKLVSEINFPIRKKYKPEFDSYDWYPVGNNTVQIFSDYECHNLGQLNWDDDDEVGVTIAKDFSYLQFPSLDDSFYFPVISNFNYQFLPSEVTQSLPLDMVVTQNRKELYFVDRGSGTLYLFDTEENKLSGAIHLRPSGHRKTLNVASTSDGRKIFATDNMSPALYTIDSKSLKTKKQPLAYGHLSSIMADKKWLYILVDKQANFPELTVLDPHSLLHRATIQLRGNLFSKVDDPCDLMALSPSGKYLLVMTYTNYPSLFTPMINVIDLESFELEEQILLRDKPSYLSFVVNKPDELVKLKSGLIDFLIELGYISEEHVLLALDKINGVEDSLPVSAYRKPQSHEEQSFGFVADENEEIMSLNKNNDDQSLSAMEKYPVLSNYEFDPSLLLAFKEEQMRYFSFLPVNKINGILTIALANPTHKDVLKQAIEQKFPDLQVNIIDFKMDEFMRFMNDFYKLIKEKYDSIISKQIDSQEAEKNDNLTAQDGKKEATPSKELKQLSAEKIKQLQNSSIKPKTDLPPNLSANIPAEVRLAVRDKLKTLDQSMLEEAIKAICLEDFHNIWGIEAAKEDIEKHKDVIKRAKDEILEKDYSFIKIENFVGQFSLEIVVNQEKLVVMLKSLSDLAQKEQSEHKGGGKLIVKATPQDDLVPKPYELKCQKCGIIIPPEIDICSKCAREDASKEISDDVRAAASPSPLANLNEGYLLISDTVRNRVVELNNSGQIIWQLGGKDKETIIHPFTAIRLRSGTTLVTDSENDRILEFTQTGRIYWELKNREGFRDLFLRRPVQAIRLLNGNTLIVDQGNHRVFEVNHLDKTVWQYGTTATVGCGDEKLYSPSYVQRLNTGHTIIVDTDNHRVIEIDENDKIVWQYGNSKNKLGSGYGEGKDQLNSPMFATKLENSNMIIVDSGNSRVIEVNQDKHIVWSFYTVVEKGSPINLTPLKAYRVKNGNTLVVSIDQIIEVGPESQLVSIKQLEFLPKAPNFKETSPPEETKVVDGIMNKNNNDKAKMATDNYVKNITNLTELEVPLIDRMTHKVYTVNRYKSIPWRFGEESETSDSFLERPQYVELIKDEYVLIADTDNHRVIKIYRPTKEIVWSYGIIGAMGSGKNQLGHPRSAVSTDSNTILITDQYSARVIEVNEEKDIVWSFGGWETGKSVINAPYYAERIYNGNTLITDWSNHIVVEVSPSGEVVWQYGTIKSAGKLPNHLMYPEKAIRTFSGNTLIADTRNNRVIEVNDSNRIVWEFINYRVGTSTRQLSSPSNVFRLENGHTVIVHNSNKHVIEVNMNSEVVWQYQVPMSEGHHSSGRIKARPD